MIARFGLILATLGLAHAFVTPAQQAVRVVAPSAEGGFSTQLYSDATGWDSFRKATDIPDGEEQRKYRRTVYTHDDWKKHRSQDRFLFYLAAIFNSGVYKNLGREVGIVTGVAAFVCLYNGLVSGFVDLSGVQQPAIISADWAVKIGLPLTPFTLCSSALGLLLGTYALSVSYLFIQMPTLLSSSYRCLRSFRDADTLSFSISH